LLLESQRCSPVEQVLGTYLSKATLEDQMLTELARVPSPPIAHQENTIFAT
jgi:hypothetical protein